MLATFLAFSLVCPQSLDPSTHLLEVGQPLQITARDAEGKPLVGLEVGLRQASGQIAALGRTDAAGTVGFVAEVPGPHEFAATLAQGTVLLALVDVQARPARWWSIWLCIPLGLAIVWAQARRARS